MKIIFCKMTYQERAKELAKKTFCQDPLITIDHNYSDEDVIDAFNPFHIIYIGLLIDGLNFNHNLKVYFNGQGNIARVGYYKGNNFGDYEYKDCEDCDKEDDAINYVNDKYVTYIQESNGYAAVQAMIKRTKKLTQRLQSYENLITALRKYGPQHIEGSNKKYLRLLAEHFKYEEGAPGFDEAKEDFEARKS